LAEGASTAPPGPGAAGLLEKSLSHEDPATVAEYLADRGEFLRQMAALDFSCYRTAAGASAPRTTPDAAPREDCGLAQRVIELVARKTGYPENLIGLDLDVEAELGLDSIKQVEIIRELAQELKRDFGSDTRSGGYQIGTLRELIRRLEETAPADPPVPPESASVTPAPPAIESEPEFRTGCTRRVSSLVEAPLPESGGASMLHGRRVALVSGDAALATAIARRIEAAGAIVADSPRAADFVLSLSGSNGHLPSLADCAGWWAGVRAETARLLDAARECANAQAGPVRWVSVSTLGGEFAAKGVSSFAPQAGLGLAMGRCLELESAARVSGLYLDFDPSMDAGSIAAAVCTEMAREPGLREIGYRNGKRYAVRWVPAAPSDAVQIKLDRSSVVLAIGGARGVTAAVCEELARRSGARFVLAGQAPVPPLEFASPTPLAIHEAREEALARALAEDRPPSPAELDRDAWDAVWAAERTVSIARLRKFAAEVEYRQCNLLDPDSVRDLVASLAERYGKIDLVLQGASALSQKAIEHLAVEDFIRDMAPKSLGTAHLLAALEGVDVGAFVNFSSVAGRWGNAGQAAYAAGHEIAANLTASAGAARGGRWFNIYFGPWLRTGMTERGAIMERLRERGIAFIEREAGAKFTADEVERGSGESVAYCGGFETSAETPSAASLAAPIFERIEVASGVAHGERTLDPTRDRFISDHQVTKGVPVVPGFLMMEMMAQASAALVDPNWQLTEISDAQFVRAAMFRQSRPRTFHVRARVLRREPEGAALSGEFYSLFTPPGSSAEQEVVHARCRLQFGHREPAPIPALVVPRSGLGDAPVDAAPLWNTEAWARRQGVWANIGWVHSVTRNGAVGQCPAPVLPEIERTPCLTHMVALDGGLTMGGLCVTLYNNVGAIYLAAVRSIRFFTSSETCTGLLCRMRTWFHASGDESSLEAIDENGRVVARLAGYRRLPADPTQPTARDEPIWARLREHPRQVRIRELLEIAAPFALAQVDIPPLAAALDLDAEALIQDYLGDLERAHFQTLTHAKRRQEWLAGRIAAKTAVRQLPAPGSLDDRTIRIVTGEAGAPGVVLEGAHTAVSPFISITHSGDLAAALATLQPGFGIDVETLGEAAREVEGEFASPEETAIIRAALNDHSVALTCLWALKEACRKAIGAADIAPRDLILRHTDRSGEYLVSVFDHTSAGAIRGVAFHDATHAYAVAGPAAASKP